MTGRPRAIALVGAAGVALLATACGSGSSGGSTASPNPSSTVQTVNANGCTPPPPLAKPPYPQYPHGPTATISLTHYVARIVTNCGTIIVSMNAKVTPITVDSFNFLAGKGYFNNTPCHRLTTEGIRVLQCGDPTGTGTGGPGYEFKDENLKGAKYTPGTVAMANSGPNTNGSQFFFVYGKSALGPHYTPFGTVTSGLSVLQRIAKAGSTPPGDGKPNQPVVIESFSVTKA